MRKPKFISALVLLFLLAVALVTSLTLVNAARQDMTVSSEGVWRPGETVTVKAELAAATTCNVSFEIDDPTGKPYLILTKEVENDTEAVLTFKLSEDAPIGDYKIYTSSDTPDAITNPSPVTLSVAEKISEKPADYTMAVIVAALIIVILLVCIAVIKMR